eukprot:2595139-Lingulodinium_polyedra.AAC.1
MPSSCAASGRQWSPRGSCFPSQAVARPTPCSAGPYGCSRWSTGFGQPAARGIWQRGSVRGRAPPTAAQRSSRGSS